jgi:hypothetical protein
MVQERREQAAIAVGERLEARLDLVVDPRMLGLVLEQQRAHHGRQREGDEARHEHGAGECQRKLDEEAPRAAGGERERREDRRQGERHRDHRERDLLRALHRRLLARHALLHVPEDVLQHDDRVVHDEADREHHRKERERVDGEAEEVHERERADQRDRDGDDRDDRRAEARRKKKITSTTSRIASAMVWNTEADRPLDEHRRVVRDDELHARRQVLVDLVDFGADAVAKARAGSKPPA